MHCGKCGAELAEPGPCPSCNDKPFGDPYLRRRAAHHPDTLGNLYEAWWQCMQDLVAIRDILKPMVSTGVSSTEKRIWKIVKDYGVLE